MPRYRLAVAAALLLTGGASHAYIDPEAPPMTRERLIEILAAHPEVTQLDQVPSLLPEPFRLNFVLKHGYKRRGERGHLLETKVSQSADPQAPRAILWDERSGFSVSWNGGATGQLAGQRLDLMSFDAKTSTFSLQQIDFPIDGGKPHPTTSDCATCHGPHQRPIFSMYPDWPSFYGSDNDELTGPSEVQRTELASFTAFRADVAPRHPRYQALFSAATVERRLKVPFYPTFPLRQDNAEQVRNVSRAFAFRPNLRMGVLFNRLNAQAVFARIKQHPRFARVAPYFLFNLLQCRWSPAAATGAAARWQKQAAHELGHEPRLREGGLLDYKDLLALFDLTLPDMDIRYSYDHAGYANEDASAKPMEVGYIGRYFNAYFDGSATSDELLAAAIHAELSRRAPSLRGLVTRHGLTSKYRHLEARYRFDRDYFAQMDRLGEWLPIPYPDSLSALQHRETYKREFVDQHAHLCGALEELLAAP